MHTHKYIHAHTKTYRTPYIYTGNVISLEVAEHLQAEDEDVYLENLVSYCSSRMLLSWALPEACAPGRGHGKHLYSKHLYSVFISTVLLVCFSLGHCRAGVFRAVGTVNVYIVLFFPDVTEPGIAVRVFVSGPGRLPIFMTCLRCLCV